jgi:hypothetical protein
MDLFEYWEEEVRLTLAKAWISFQRFKLDYQPTCCSLSTEYLTNGAQQIWWLVKRQPAVTQIFLTVMTILTLVSLVSCLYVKLTKKICKSQARLDGKTALVTGANCGKNFKISR